jgi:hypothetical protein
MTVGCKLHELVSRLGSTVIPDTTVLATHTGQNADLQAGCHNDVRGSQLAPVKDLIRRALCRTRC